LAQFEKNKAVVTFIRQLPADFGGFHSRMVSIDGHVVQMLYGSMNYQKTKMFVAIFARPGMKKDSVVLSLPLFHIPEHGASELFQQLLTWNNGATENVHFAVDEALNSINLVCVRGLDGMDYREFHYCVINLVAVAKNATARLQKEYGLMRIA
jgi:hypothetical protein